MESNYQNLIDKLSNKELFNCLTKKRYEYNKTFIESAESTFEKRKLDFTQMQTDSEQSIDEIKKEIKERILNNETTESLKSQFKIRGIGDLNYLVDSFMEIDKKTKDKEISKMFFNFLIFNLFFAFLSSFILKESFLIYFIIPILFSLSITFIYEIISFLIHRKTNFNKIIQTMYKIWKYVLIFCSIGVLGNLLYR